MNNIKKILGLFWVILGPLSMIFMCMQAWEKVNLAHEGIDRTNTALQWGIILLIFIPIAIGLVIFGKYAWQGEYED